MLKIHFILTLSLCLTANALPNSGNIKDVPQGDLPDNWDQTKDTQDLFENKDNKQDLEPYPLALTAEDNQNILRDSAQSAKQNSELENLVIRSELYGEPPSAFESSYDIRRKRGSGTKVGGAGATKIATKAGGKKNLKSLIEPNRSKRSEPSGLSAADVRALLAMWEAQERRKQELNRLAERYYSRNSDEEDQPDFEDSNEMWYNEALPINEYHPSYFSEQNRYAHVYPERQVYADRPKRYMIARKRNDGAQIQYRPREDLYTLAELLRSGPPRRDEMPSYRRHIM